MGGVLEDRIYFKGVENFPDGVIFGEIENFSSVGVEAFS